MQLLPATIILDETGSTFLLRYMRTWMQQALPTFSLPSAPSGTAKDQQFPRCGPEVRLKMEAKDKHSQALKGNRMPGSDKEKENISKEGDPSPDKQLVNQWMLVVAYYN